MSLLDQLKHKHWIWNASDVANDAPCQPTGFAELDDKLGGGFPVQGVVDIQSPLGIGELRLLLPSLLERHRAQERLLVFIAPPLTINAEMFAEFGFDLERVLVIDVKDPQQALWSAEQCLKSGSCHGALLWHKGLEIHHVKRLQLAAEVGEAIQVLLQPSHTQTLSLPVPLAMTLSPHQRGLMAKITKRRGGSHSAPFIVNMQHFWPELARVKSTVGYDNVLPIRSTLTG